MLDDASPRILSPNLGCPLILSLEELNREGFEIVIACCQKDWESTTLEIVAHPSFQHDGLPAIPLTLDWSNRSEIVDDSLPPRFAAPADTRFLISTTLRTALYAGNARFARVRVRPSETIGEDHFRHANGRKRGTLYDLQLMQDAHLVHSAVHAIGLRPKSADVRFIHLTDLHVAARNDLMDVEVNCTVNASPPGIPLAFNNFNDHLRSFIREANRLADQGELDFVLALGDLVDFVNPGITGDAPNGTNWQTLVEILTGAGSESSDRGNPGLRVPVFTTTGNHDWRPNTYPPAFSADIFGLPEKILEKFDYLYSDTDKAVGDRISEVQSKLVAQGSPILQRSWWGSAVGRGLEWVLHVPERVMTWIVAAFKKFVPSQLLPGIFLAVAGFLLHRWPAAQNWLSGLFGNSTPIHIGTLVIVAIVALVIITIALRLVGDYFTGLLRQKIEGLIAIESSTDGLLDYFLLFNPYFNFAFHLEKCYFALMDSGHDALTGQSFWDEGGKKIRRLNIKDNILGGSPESMGFYPANECYPYSQLAWLENVLECVRRAHPAESPESPRSCRVIVGLHAPPANLSAKQRRRADGQVQQQKPLLLPRKWFGGFDIHYGTVNHYVSQFFYLCLGFRESSLIQPSGPGVDLVLSGHAHWNIEFQLQRPAEGANNNPNSNNRAWHPQVFYGNFAAMVESGYDPKLPNRWWSPLLLQTAASGPPSKTAAMNPYYRPVHIDARLAIRSLRVCHLNADRIPEAEDGPSASASPN